MQTSNFSYRSRLCFLLLFLVVIVSCKSDNNVIPAAQNIFKGEVDGTSFQVDTSEIASIKNEDLFAVSGIINSDVEFSLYFRGATTSTHEVTDTGIFINTVEYIKTVAETLLDEVVQSGGNVDSIPVTLFDSISVQFEDVFTDSTQILGTNEAFMFYFINSNIYYSSDGFVELTEIDSSLNRISGNFEIELSNLPGGTKNLVGIFEEIEYSE